MKLKCIKDTETLMSGIYLFRNSSQEKIEGLTEGKVYDGEILALNVNERRSFVYFCAFDDDGEWSYFDLNNFVPVKDL